MRLKQFLILVVVFTIIYALFWILIDYLHSQKIKKEEKERMDKVLSLENYLRFAAFYGIQSTISGDLIRIVFEDVRKASAMIISSNAARYQIQPYEFVVLVLFFEYNHLISKRSISLEGDIIDPISYENQGILYKYNNFLQEKKSADEFAQMYGEQAIKDLVYLDHNFLIPGIRYWNSNLYYVGDGNESS